MVTRPRSEAANPSSQRQELGYVPPRVSAVAAGGGLMQSGGALAIANGGVTTAKLADDAVTFAKFQNFGAKTLAGATANGDGELITLDPGDLDISAGVLFLTATGVGASSYGDATHIPTFTVNTEGRLSAASSTLLRPIFPLRVVTAAGAVTVVSASDCVVVVNKTVGVATTVNLPATPTVGQWFTIKDGKGDAAVNNITLTPAAGTIDGAATYILTSNYQSATVTYNGAEWNVI